MEMIIGGVYQGKENYARKNFPDITWKKGSELTEEELGVTHREKALKQILNYLKEEQ